MNELLDRLFPEPEKPDGYMLFAEEPQTEVDLQETVLYLPSEIEQSINNSCKIDWGSEDTL